MPNPEQWPTTLRLEDAKNFAHWSRVYKTDFYAEIGDAAVWAVTVRPQLEALVEQHAARGQWNPGLKQALDELAALLALTPHKETQG